MSSLASFASLTSFKETQPAEPLMPPGKKTPPVRPSDKVKILLVDDDPANLLAMEAVLECLGQEIVTATSGEEALGLMLKDEFAVILLDGHMPGMDGFETAEMIHRRPRSRHTPIIFVTGSFVSDESIFRGYSEGAVDYILKPVVNGILRAKVEAFIDLARMRKRLEGEIAEKTRMAAEVGQLNLEQEKKNRELRAANASLEAFSYSVAHDLRSPLANILGYVGLVEMNKPQLSEELQDHLKKVTRGARRMEEMIRDMLNFARAGHAGVKAQSVPLDEVVAEVIREDLSPEGRRIEWSISPLPSVKGDRALLRQVFANLLSNAVKYTGHREVAKIEIGWTDAPKERLVFVKDNGAGFDMAKASKLFGVFQRLHTDAEFQGTGIGLSLVRSIVEKHGGRVWAEGKVDEGSVFYIALPK